MKKLLLVAAFTLALNFLASIGAVAWLFKTGQLDKDKLHAIQEIVFPPPPATQPTTQPVEEAVPPMMKLEELLAKTSGMPAAEQLEYIRKSFDTQMAQLDLQTRKLVALQQLVDSNRAELTLERTKLDKDRQALEARQKEADRLATDKGFQDSLTLYQSMPPAKVKAIFAGLEDATVLQYIQAMDARAAAKVMKEFKTPEEIDRLKRIMEKMRQAQVSTKE